MLLAWGHNRLCYLGFIGALDDIEQRWLRAKLNEKNDRYGLMVNEDRRPPINLYGTSFEHKVWLELLNIPQGKTSSYGELATSIDKPTTQRAVASAIGRNPNSINCAMSQSIARYRGVRRLSLGAFR
jgi:O-6-methylguanine DNA methyltransferase